MTKPMDGQVAIITGAGRGLGRSYALLLAELGAHIVVNDAGIALNGRESDADGPAESVVAEIEAMGGQALAANGSIADPDFVQSMVDAAMERWGRIDILVCNAGIMDKITFSGSDAAAMQRHFDVHVMGSYLPAKACFDIMKAQGYGRIVMTASQVGFYGQHDAAAYGTAKMATIGLMHAMKLDCEGTGIRVNCVAPFAMTRMGRGTFPDHIEPWIAPEVVAPAVAYLAHSDCALQGEILVAGGGHFAVARMAESLGTDIERPGDVTLDAVMGRMDEITDLGKSAFYPDALAAVGKTFDRILAAAETEEV